MDYLAQQGYTDEEIHSMISSDTDVGDSGFSGDTIYIDNSRFLDSGDLVQVDTLSVIADSVLLSAPEDNVYPPSAPLAGGVYMQVETSQLGVIIIYVPVSYQSKAFTFAANTSTPINITASTISGYAYASSDYSVRWSSFGRATYRRVDGTGSYNNLDITSVLNTNIVFIEDNADLPVIPDNNILQIISIFLLGVMVLCLFMRRL